MEVEVVCQFHLESNAKVRLWPVPYPRVLYRDAERLGWKRTNDPLFSMDGSAVWLCPDCVAWQEDYHGRGPVWQSARGLLFAWQDWY